MKTHEFINKWNVAYEDLEQKKEFAIDMNNDLRQYAKEQTISLIKAMKKGGKSYAYNLNQWLKDNDIDLKYDEI